MQEVFAPRRRRASRGLAGFAAATLVLAPALGLGGCVEEYAANASAVAAPARPTPRPGVSPAGAPVAFASFEGAPAAVIARYTHATQAAAATRSIIAASPQDAAYLARGYLSATPLSDGTAINAVWDVYDRAHRRVQRIENVVEVQGSPADPWSLADDRALAALAGLASDDLAATLTNTPEAIDAAARGPVVATNPAADETAAPALPPGVSAYR